MHRRLLFLTILLLFIPSSGAAWGERGHRMVNRLAIEAAGGVLPAFMKASGDHLIYNGYEPDRWREESGSPLNAAAGPDHFFDSELWGDIATIPGDRYAFMMELAKRRIGLADIGYLPYAIGEGYGRLRNAFRQWRNAKTPEDREGARANAVFYAGLLGHYVADGSQPMHLSIHFNGWADGTPNPRNFTKDRMFHNRYETSYVNRALQDSHARAKVRPPERLQDVAGAVKTYLKTSFAELEAMYEMEKGGEFNPESPRPRGTDFIAGQLARAASMLGSLWYTAWIESGEPVARKP